MAEVVTFGESMGLLMPQFEKTLESSQTLEFSFGGAESNVAIGLSRLGHEAGWFGRLGSDPVGKKIAKQLRAEGVDVSRIVWDDGHATGMMMREVQYQEVSVYYHRKHSAASHMVPADLDEAYIASAQILHVTGITPALSDNCLQTVREAIRMAKKHVVKVSFDPNLRLKLWDIAKAREVIWSLAEEADYFLPGFDELKLLLDESDWERMRPRLNELDAISVVKGVERNTCIVQRSGVTSVPFMNVDNVVDTIGAGDGFCAGFLSGLLRGWPLEKAVQLANVNGAMVIQMKGDWEAAPTWELVKRRMENQAHIER
ncbi:sugar kinase [Marinicrinis lubricantis]|uniref:Sugar kinase n=1 Tax=Marinicrinis lubricantis TaxID=2086470 RepID=A0ABW1ILP6_9BACL